MKCKSGCQANHVHGDYLENPRVPNDLHTITDVVLRYRPPEKLKAAKKRAKRKAQRDAKKG